MRCAGAARISQAARYTAARVVASAGLRKNARYFLHSRVEENLTVGVAVRPLDARHVYGLFPRLRERRGNMGNQLSGGEQQMLAIARALMTNPTLLLLDEPLEGLAPIIVEELSAAIGRMIAQEGTALILVEQHAGMALTLTQEAVVMERGTIVHRAPSRELLSDAATLDRLIGLRVERAASPPA